MFCFICVCQWCVLSCKYLFVFLVLCFVVGRLWFCTCSLLVVLVVFVLLHIGEVSLLDFCVSSCMCVLCLVVLPILHFFVCFCCWLWPFGFQ